jgi:hypothetical protein
MSIELILAGLVLLACAYHFLTRPKDIRITMPNNLRTDLLFGYYGRLKDQVAQTARHTNLLWECQFEGTEAAIAAILEAKKYTVLDVSPQMFIRIAEHGRNFRLREDAHFQLYLFFEQLRQSGALEYIKAITPLDEPNTNAESFEDFAKAIAIIRQVSANYPVLAGVKVACIYAREPEEYPAIGLLDLVGMDDYEMKSSLLTSQSFKRMRAQMRPGAQLILLPGGAFGQDPQPFLAYAHKDEGVAMIVAFVWFGPMQPADKWVGIGESQMRSLYLDAGLQITGVPT